MVLLLLLVFRFISVLFPYVVFAFLLLALLAINCSARVTTIQIDEEAPRNSSALYTCTCSQGACSNIPKDNAYFLTSFCDKSVSCPPGTLSGWGMTCNSYYSADRQRFGCGSTIQCCCTKKSGVCANLRVIDFGPACSVENSAGGPVVDASSSMCKTCTGGTSCGWSDRVPVTCKKIGEAGLSDSMLGPCTTDPEQFPDLPVCQDSY